MTRTKQRTVIVINFLIQLGNILLFFNSNIGIKLLTVSSTKFILILISIKLGPVVKYFIPIKLATINGAPVKAKNQTF